jgi:hypothetical protein
MVCLHAPPCLGERRDLVGGRARACVVNGEDPMERAPAPASATEVDARCGANGRARTNPISWLKLKRDSHFSLNQTLSPRRDCRVLCLRAAGPFRPRAEGPTLRLLRARCQGRGGCQNGNRGERRRNGRRCQRRTAGQRTKPKNRPNTKLGKEFSLNEFCLRNAAEVLHESRRVSARFP